jgi:solute:Na+ symporter, SSS family
VNFSTLDLVVVAAYFIGIIAAGLLAVRRQKLTGEMYFLAGRSLRWPVVGAALFASNISTIHLVGLAEGGYKYGLVIGNFEWMATFSLILLALVFAPFYFRAHISTLPEFLERRYSPLARSVMACMAIAAALLIHIGISLYAGAVVFREFFGISVTASITIISVATAIYTVVGGLRAVVVTETIQTVLLLFGAVLVTWLGIRALPAAGVHNWDEFRAALRPGQLSMLQTTNREGFAWYAILLGYPVLGVWYWCTDQTIVQRVLGARTERDAQHGALFAGLLKILPVFLMVLPGVIGYVLFRDVIGTNASETFPVLINRLVPPGLRGLLAAGLLAALMSTIAAALNSVGTLVALDLVKHFRPQTSDRAQVRIGASSAVVLMMLAMLWSTQGGRFGSIFEAINKMPAQFLAPPIATVFVWGVFYRRGTNAAAVTTLFLGFSLGFVAFLVDLPAFGDTQWITDPVRGLGVSFMMQAWWGFCLCSAIYVIVSWFTPAPDPARVVGITWDRPLAVLFHGKLTGWSDPRAVAGLLLAGMLTLYWIFH